MRRTARLLTSFAAAALLVGAAACGDDDDAATTDTTPTTDAPAVNLGDDPETEQAVAGCERLDERPDGVYVVGDAGEAVLEFDGSTVRLAETRPADGWTATEDTEDDDDEVEVTFSSDEDRAIQLEAEVDDGRLEIDVCER
jgi:hypothetical protein